MIRTRIRKFGFLPTALAVGVAIPILAGTGAFAQQPSSPAAAPTDQGPIAQGDAGAIGAASAQSEPAGIGMGSTAETERIIVTGSNIPTAQEVGPNPVLNINRDLINKSGERSAEALIKSLPVANGGGVPISNNATGFTPGASAISLRGLGPEATLVLMDGRRLAPYPIGNGGTSSFFDLRSIPEAAIESIEILKDGASTTYGADAIAGVVNIKMRHDYKGAEAAFGYGNTLDKDSGEIRGYLLFGVGDENTQVTGMMNYYKRNSIYNRDRGYSAVPPFLSSNATPENLQLTFEAVTEAGGTPPAGTVPGDEFFGGAPTGSNGLSPASNYLYDISRIRAAGGLLPGFDYNKFSASYPDIESYGGMANVSHKIYGDQMVLFADFMYQYAESHDELAASATGDFQTPGQITLAIPPRVPNPGGDLTPTGLGGPTYAETGVPAGAFNPWNPFNQIISAGSRARILEFGNRLSDNATDNFIATIGLRGDKLFDGTWGYDMGLRYNRIKVTSISTVVSTSRYNQVLNQADPVFGPGGALEGQAAFNPFGDAQFGPAIASNQAAIDFVTVKPRDVDTSEVGVFDLNIYTTELFKLPAGGIGFAFGGQFRNEQLTQGVDQMNLDGDIIGNTPSASTAAGRKDWALYAEANIPIFSPTFNFPGFYAMDLTAAVRYEVFRNNDTNVCVPKFGIRWQPIDETLTIRATIGEGFREPSLIELYGSPTAGLAGVTDILPASLGGPATPVGDESRFEPEETVVSTSQPFLEPEDSRSFTCGFVYTPKFVSGLTVSVDIWDTERTGVVVVSQINGQQGILQRELNQAAGTGQGLLPGEIVERNPNTNQIVRIFTPFINSGSLKANGVDFGVQYIYPTKWGTFTSLTNATWLNSYQFSATAGGGESELAGAATDPELSEDGYLKWRANSSIDWSWNGWDVTTTVRYIDGFRDRTSNGRIHYTSQTWVFDGIASYDFTYVAPVENQPVAGYSKDAKDMEKGKDGKAVASAKEQTANYALPIWKRCLNGTQISLGCDNLFGVDPPQAYGFGGNGTNYPSFLYDSTGRFVYFQIKKKF